MLRGPQGTLFGKNASAGVVNITTKRPSDTFEGYVDVSLFQDDEYRTKARVSGPLMEGVNASLTMMDSGFDGFIDNVFTNEKINGYDRQGFRAMFDIDAGDDTQVLVILEDYDADNDCCADIELSPSGRNPASEAAPNSSGKGDLDLDQRRVDHDFETRTLDSTSAMSVQIEHQMGDYTLTSITARRTWDNTEFREGDFTSIAGDSNDKVFGVPFQLHDIGPQEWRQLSQEIRLASPAGEQLEWQIGGFYWDIDSARNFTRFASCQDNNGQLAAAIGNHIGSTDETAINDFIAAEGITCNANDIVDATAYMSTEFTNYAFFGEGNFDITEDLSVLFGLRYTYDEVSFQHNRRNNDEYGRRGVGVRPRVGENGSNQEDTNFDGKTDDSNVSGKLGLQWRINEDNMVYGTYATGYKGPAFNVFYNLDSDDINPINAEESDSIEVGYKYTGDSLYLSLAYYSTEIENFQANKFDTSDGTTTTGFTNGGDVETSGFEGDFVWQASQNLKLIGGFAVSDAETTIGQELPFAPDTKWSLSSEYSIAANSGAEWLINASYVYTDEQLSGNIGQTAESNPEILLPDYSILNASLTYVSPEDRYRVSLIGKNLTDESYVTTYSGDGFRYQVPRDADRYFGVNFRLNF